MINSYQQRLLKFGFFVFFFKGGGVKYWLTCLKNNSNILDQYIMNIIYGVKKFSSSELDKSVLPSSSGSH